MYNKTRMKIQATPLPPHPGTKPRRANCSGIGTRRASCIGVKAKARELFLDRSQGVRASAVLGLELGARAVLGWERLQGA